MEKPTLSDVLYALKITTGKNPFDAKYDVNGDGEITTADVLGLQKSYLGKDPGFAFADNTFLSPSTKTAEQYAAEEKANQERIAAEQKETARRQTLLSDAQKMNGLVTADLVANNPNLNAQQLASLAQRNYWSNEAPAFGSLMSAMENGTAQVKNVQIDNEYSELQLISPDGNSVPLRATPQEGVYQFSVYNPTAGGTITGVIQADPKTGQYKPVADYTRQIQYTPGQGGGFLGGVIGSFGDIIKELGPVATIIGNGIMPGLGTALSVAAAIDEGANPADIAKTIAISEGLSQSGLSQNVAESVGSQAAGQLAAGTVGGLLSGQNLETALTGALTNLRPTNQFEAEVNQALDTPATQLSGQDLAADNTAGNTIQDVIAVIANDVTNNLTGQDLAADTVTGNTLQDVINNLMQDTIQSVVAQDTTTGGQDTLTSGQDLSADTVTGANTLTDITNALAGEGSLISSQDLASDLKTGTANTLNDIAIALAGEGSAITGQDLAADATAGNTLADITNVLTNTKTDTTKTTTVDDVLNTLSDIAKVAAVVGAGDALVNSQAPTRTGFDIVPVPTDWKSPVYNQQFTPVDLTTIFDNLNRLQNTQWATPRVYGGAYQGSPVNISDIVNQIMSSQLTPSTMPSQITNAVGGVLGPSTIS